MKLTKLERRRAYKRAYELLGKINSLLDKALIAHEKAYAEQSRDRLKDVA